MMMVTLRIEIAKRYYKINNGVFCCSRDVCQATFLTLFSFTKIWREFLTNVLAICCRWYEKNIFPQVFFRAMMVCSQPAQRLVRTAYPTNWLPCFADSTTRSTKSDGLL
jgi:hypothetical protein